MRSDTGEPYRPKRDISSSSRTFRALRFHSPVTGSIVADVVSISISWVSRLCRNGKHISHEAVS
jgi:hypothetical protein